MRFFMALGVIMWVLIAVWLVRLGMRLDHLSKNQIAIMLVCGPVGGLAGGVFRLPVREEVGRFGEAMRKERRARPPAHALPFSRRLIRS